MKIETFKKIFILLSVFLTTISLAAGYYVYAQLFGLATAILIASVFEVLRLSCLFSIPYFDNHIYRIFAGILYICVALVCFFSAVVSFNSRVIDRNQIRTTQETVQMQKDLYSIKNVYQKKIDQELKLINERRQVTEKKHTSWQSDVYKRRLELYDKKTEELLDKRDIYFEELGNKSNNLNWISDQKAILGIDTETVYLKNDSIALAIIEMLGVESITTQKIFGFALTLIVEFGIVILAIMGFGLKAIIPFKINYKEESDIQHSTVKQKKNIQVAEDNLTKLSSKDIINIQPPIIKQEEQFVENDLPEVVSEDLDEFILEDLDEVEKKYKESLSRIITDPTRKGISANLKVGESITKKDIMNKVEGAENI